MPQETVGYVELEWTCKFCGTRNPGMQKLCTGCGAPMSQDDKFEAPAEQKLIADEQKLKQAQAAPEVACPYCGARNAADAAVCKQCGGDLAGAKAREAGQVIGAFQSGPAPEVTCPFCGTSNPASAAKCKSCGGMLGKAPLPPATPKAAAAGRTSFGIVLVALLAVICIGGAILMALGSRTSDAAAAVQSVSWKRVIPVLALAPVDRAGWRDQIPVEAELGRCTERARGMSDQPTERSRKVCGTPYVIDQGTGAGKVVQDCQFEVLDDWCEFTVQEWRVVGAIEASGDDLNPRWPDLQIGPGRRAGERQEQYQVVFLANDKRISYRPATEQEFKRYTPGSRWLLKINGFGSVTDVQPAP